MKHITFHYRHFNECHNGDVKIFSILPYLDFKWNYEFGIRVRTFVFGWLVWGVALGWTDGRDLHKK